MKGRAAITVNRPRHEVEELWRTAEPKPPHIAEAEATVTFRDAPGDRGTEIHVDLGEGSGALGRVVEKVTGGRPSLDEVKDDLRRFKARVETGEVPRSDASPEGDAPERKLKQRPAQPLDASELEQVGAR